MTEDVGDGRDTRGSLDPTLHMDRRDGWVGNGGSFGDGGRSMGQQGYKSGCSLFLLPRRQPVLSPWEDQTCVHLPNIPHHLMEHIRCQLSPSDQVCSELKTALKNKL